jgi:aminoglycoside 6'-N-acetyltransferase
MTPGYVFRPMTAADLPLVRRWLALPHVMEWWVDPEEQYALVSGDLDEPAMDQYAFRQPAARLVTFNVTI